MRQFRKLLLAVVAILLLAPQTFAYDYTELSIDARRDFVFDDSGVLYVTAGDSIWRFDTNSGTFLSPFFLGGNLVGIDLSPDSTTLAVADESTQDTTNRIVLVDTATGKYTEVDFARDRDEAGTYMVAWGADNRVLISSSFFGSGLVPLRRYDPELDETDVLGAIDQNSMLSASADRQTIGLAGANSSDGPVFAYDVAIGGLVSATHAGWATFEVAVSPFGDQFVVPTYDGAFVYEFDGMLFTRETTLGQYSVHGPIGAAFSPTANVLYTAEFDREHARSGVQVYDATTWAHIDTLDNYDFPWSGAGSLIQGRVRVSPDGAWLAVSVQYGLRIYCLP